MDRVLVGCCNLVELHMQGMVDWVSCTTTPGVVPGRYKHAPIRAERHHVPTILIWYQSLSHTILSHGLLQLLDHIQAPHPEPVHF